MIPTPNLNQLLEALWLAGFPAGVGERIRLQQIFRLAPRWGGDAAPHLKSVLRAVLLKDIRQADRFDKVCDQWLLGWSLQPPSPPQPPPPPPTPSLKPRWSKYGLSLVLLLFIGLYGDSLKFIVIPSVRSPSKVEEPKPPKLTEPKPQSLDDLRKASFVSRKPRLSVSTPNRHFTAWRELSLGLFALALSGVLWRETKRRRWLPEQEPPPTRLGPPRVYLHRELREPVMLNPDDQQALVWGIDHYAALDETRRLDIPATVKATALAAGITTVVRQGARHQREVWLWLDEAAEETGLSRLVQEMAALLPNYGLYLEQAGFWGLPYRLQGPDGRSFAPREIEDRRATARVAILTDGRHLARLWQSDNQRNRINGLLRQLSHWPELWFVDSSLGASGLAKILLPHGISCIKPAQLPHCLAGSAERKRPNANTDEAIWAAAMAFAPSAVDEGMAWRIREALSLRVDPCALDRLRSEAQGPAGRLLWRRALRADRVNWLANMEKAEGGGKTVLDRVLDFWLAAYRDEALQRAGAGGVSWQDSPAERHLRMEQALLKLWRKPPSEAIAELYRLYRGDLVDSIRLQMAALSPNNCGKPDQIRLPWHWDELSGPEKQMLYAMNFAEAMTGKVELRQPGRLWLGFGLGIAMGTVGLLFALLKPWELPNDSPRVQHQTDKPAVVAEAVQYLGLGRWRVSVVTPDWRVETLAPSGSTVTVAWPGVTYPCREDLSGMELWHGSCLHPSSRLSPPIAHSLAVLDASANDASPLVIALLQSGSADTVLTSNQLPSVDKGGAEINKPLSPEAGVGGKKPLSPQAEEGSQKPLSPEGKWVGERGSAEPQAGSEHNSNLLSHTGFLTGVSGNLTSQIPDDLSVDADPEHTQLFVISPKLTVNAVELSKEGRNKPALAGVSGMTEAQMPETVAGRPYFGLQPNLPHTLWLQASDWQSLANALNFTGERSVAQVWPKAAVIAGDPKQTRLLGNCQAQADTDANGMKFVRLCAGRFLMGSPNSEKDRYKDESPQHWVSLSAFELGQTEVTHLQYRKFKPDHLDNDDKPVVGVSWNQAKAYCEHYGYRLPTEAEWEYAARAGSTGRWPFGEDESQLDGYAWYRQNADNQTHPVGQKQPNRWGLYDMAGNVWEWVADWYGPYSADPQTNPTGPAVGDSRVLRGGAFVGEPRGLRSAGRGWFDPEFENWDGGFRCARGPRP